MPVTGPSAVVGTLDTGEYPGQAVLVASGAHTATGSVVFAPGVHDIVSVTVVTTAYSAGGVTPSLEFYDAASDTWISMLTGAKIVGTGTGVTLSVGPKAVTAANVGFQSALAPYMRVTMTVDDATAITYSIGVRAS